MTDRPRILLADDHFPVRANVRRRLEEDGFELCAETADAASAVAAALRERPDICLLEVKLPGDGLAAAAEICERVPDAAVIMLTASTEDSDLFAALRAGASGYLLKDMDPERLGHTLRGVLEGEAALAPRLVTRLIEDYRRLDRPRRLRIGGPHAAELTERESEVVGLMRKDLSTAEIAAHLGVSRVTVRRHISALLSKLGVTDRESALRRVKKYAKRAH